MVLFGFKRWQPWWVWRQSFCGSSPKMWEGTKISNQVYGFYCSSWRRDLAFRAWGEERKVYGFSVQLLFLFLRAGWSFYSEIKLQLGPKGLACILVNLWGLFMYKFLIWDLFVIFLEYFLFWWKLVFCCCYLSTCVCF